LVRRLGRTMGLYIGQVMILDRLQNERTNERSLFANEQNKGMLRM